MHSHYFPPCPIEGPIPPSVPYGHMGTRGAVPQKCSKCKMLFEGECTRYMADVGHYLHLDHGPCGVRGPTDPVAYEDRFISGKVEVPRKCASCGFLRVDHIRGFICTKDSEIWGGLPRGLDWGAWRPDTIYLDLPHPKITTKLLVKCAHENDLVGFAQEYRRVNLGTSLAEAREDFAHFRRILDKMNGSTKG